MKYQPEGSKVIVKPDEVDERTSGGIILTPMSVDSIKTRVNQGTILAIGPTADLLFEKDRPAKVGDQVIFAVYGGFTFMDVDTREEYRVLNDEDIVCWVKDGQGQDSQ